ncbi:cytochrome P450 [Periconia macrospinosa]|uniref:Cytochrome P450 n=1 Tax=Periconia macrospinosa TaxID=97972 RepID=A0A2V1E0G1_9PLEO|nr:cytochrome P450 [Periconia macrospinosa]
MMVLFLLSGQAPLQSTVITSSVLLATYILYRVIFNLYFHPLRNFPGPILARSSLLWRVIHSTNGQIHRKIQAQHHRYGPVIRVSPNELSFASLSSWKAIYGHQSAGAQIPTKSEFYDMYGSAHKEGCIGSERDPQKHVRMKRTLANSFSTRALAEQEPIISDCIDKFIKEIGNKGRNGIDMVKWYEMVAFDILGEMAFGESFGAVESGEPHFWSELVIRHVFAATVLDNMRRYPFMVTLGKLILPRLTVSVRDKHSGYTRAKVQQRLESKSDRKDFFTNVIQKVHSGEMSREEMVGHASTLVIAGGETVATELVGITYYLLKSPKIYEKLRQEIQGAFTAYSDITAAAAQRLPYLQAVIEEGLRIFPSGALGFPRKSPGMHVDNHWIPQGTEIYTSAWTVHHDAKYFHDPYSFKPERWLNPDCTDAKEASQPFSLGPRGCLGRNFAYVEMNLILAKMLWQFDLDLVDKDFDLEEQSRMHVMWWKPGMYVRIKPNSNK